jgi:hypothetical protein
MYDFISVICEAVARGITRGILKELKENDIAEREKPNAEDLNTRDSFRDLVNRVLHPPRKDGNTGQHDSPPNSGRG